MMTCEEPHVSDTGLYNTKETYTALGISYKTLMAMVDDGRIRPRLRMSGTRRPMRVFQGREIKRCWRTII